MTQINAGHIENLTIHEAPPGAPEVAPPGPPLPDPGRRRMAVGSALFSLGLVVAQNPDIVMQILGLFGK